MWFEHWHRYQFVEPLVKGLRVLDVACGEGYGSDRLAASALEVGGVDVSEAAIAHASAQYARPNLSFRVGSCIALPVADSCIDALISFETLEHIDAHDAFMREIRRVLSPKGWALISTPNKAEYSDARAYRNEFHVKELYRNEFEDLLKSQFSNVLWLTQRNGFHSIIAREAPPVAEFQPIDAALRIESMTERAGQIPPPLFFLAFVSNDSRALASLSLATSAFTAFEDNQVDTFMQVWRHSQHLEKRVVELEAQLGGLAKVSITKTDTSRVAPPANDSWLERTLKKLSS